MITDELWTLCDCTRLDQRQCDVPGCYNKGHELWGDFVICREHAKMPIPKPKGRSERT